MLAYINIGSESIPSDVCARILLCESHPRVNLLRQILYAITSIIHWYTFIGPVTSAIMCTRTAHKRQLCRNYGVFGLHGNISVPGSCWSFRWNTILENYSYPAFEWCRYSYYAQLPLKCLIYGPNESVTLKNRVCVPEFFESFVLGAELCYNFPIVSCL